MLSPEAKAHLMAEALAESRKALPACRPNPPVGCVIARNGRILARGFTGPPGEPHAEAAAIRSLGPDAAAHDLVAFVTLEPCAFAGRTPSCARAIAARGIGSVSVALIDPDPRNNGKGLQVLRDAGIGVELGILEREVRSFLEPYLVSRSADPARLRLAAIDRSGIPREVDLALDRSARGLAAATADLYTRVGFVPPWIGYLAVTGEGVVGGCGFKAPPVRGEVEIAYHTFPPFEGRGLATAMVRELVAIARGADPGVVVTAQTLPRPNASTAILERHGFARRGVVTHPEDGEVWEWELKGHGPR